MKFYFRTRGAHVCIGLTSKARLKTLSSCSGNKLTTILGGTLIEALIGTSFHVAQSIEVEVVHTKSITPPTPTPILKILGKKLHSLFRNKIFSCYNFDMQYSNKDVF